MRPIYWLRQLEVVPHGYDEPVEVRTRLALRCACGWFTQADPGCAMVTCRSCGRVNDEAVRILAAMPGLRELDLKGSSITEKGLATLRAAKPKAVIYYGPWEARAASFRNN